MKWPNNSGAATRSVPRICSLLIGGLALGWSALGGASLAQAESLALFGGTIEALTLNVCAANPDLTPDIYCGGTITVAGKVIIIPRNLLIDLPANRLTLQQIFADAPLDCKDLGQSGLASADTCLSAVPGAASFPGFLANRQLDGSIVTGEFWIEKGAPESMAGVVTYVDYADGYVEIEGVTGTQGSGVMIRINDPSGRHTIQSGLGCDGGFNCSADPRFGLDADNYTITFITGYPACIPSIEARGVSNGSDPASGVGDALCPATNRQADSIVPDSTRFAPIQLGDHLSADGNFEQIGALTDPDGDLIFECLAPCARFLSAHTLTVNRALTTSPGQPDYMLFDEVEWDVAGYQNERVRMLMIGFTTLAPAHVEIYRLAVNRFDEFDNSDPPVLINAAGSDNLIPLASSAGCDLVAGAASCTRQGIPPNDSGIFKIRFDVDFLVGAPVKPLLSPCSHLIAAQSLGEFAGMDTGCSPSPTIEDEFQVIVPITREMQAITTNKRLNPFLVVLDINGIETTWGQYLTPVGIGHPEFVEIDLAKVFTSFIFEGETWNLDRRTSPGGAGDATNGIYSLDPFPCSGLDPRTQAVDIPSNADRILAVYPFGPDDYVQSGPDTTGCTPTVVAAGGGGGTEPPVGEPPLVVDGTITVVRARFSSGNGRKNEWRISGELSKIGEADDAFQGENLSIYLTNAGDPAPLVGDDQLCQSPNCLGMVTVDNLGFWDFRLKNANAFVPIPGDTITVQPTVWPTLAPAEETFIVIK